MGWKLNKFWPFGNRAAKAADAGRVAALEARLASLQARYDAAQTTADNRRHWAGADNLSADNANSPAVRTVLRNRCRYEAANNGYAKGIERTLANDVIGRGPRLQALTDDPAVNAAWEKAWSSWCKRVKLARKLRVMRMARQHDGEAFAELMTNPNLNGPVKLDLRLIEADQVASPWPMGSRGDPALRVDGLRLDEYDNVVGYFVLDAHPGSGHVAAAGGWREVPARDMIHWFSPDRPGQHRAIPEMTPSLELYGQLRRFTRATVLAAETAANMSVVMSTTSPPDGEAAEVPPMTEMEMAANMAVFAPEGWEPKQMRAEQPTTAYGPFKREIVSEAARPVSMPYNVAACDSSSYNYASGRLDHQTYFKATDVDQADCEEEVLDRILLAWMAEAVRVIETLASLSLESAAEELPAHQWFWPGHEHVDPAKEANAQATRLASHSTTLAAEYAREGKDWETELRQRAKEVHLCRELGLPIERPAGESNADDDEDDEADNQRRDQQSPPTERRRQPAGQTGEPQ
jgi:lambda family phage portal protein